MRWFLPLLLFMQLWTQTAFAHNTPIALLTLSERQVGVFDADWTYSSSTIVNPPAPTFPAHCTFDYPRLNCGETGLVGTLTMEQLGERYSAAVVQIHWQDGRTDAYTLTGANPTITLTPTGKLPLDQVAAAYIPLGFEHILLGVDHLLFVLGLMWLVSSTAMLVKTITAFTIAHSLTLAAVTLGWIGVPEQPVNAAIALSIAIVAVEVLKHQRGERCLSADIPWAIAFGFGLLHGFGFAGALTKIGLPQENVPSALLFFNVGVELGQLAFVLVMLALVWSHKVLQAQLPAWSRPATIYGMGAIGSFWFLSRLHLILIGA
ncbi:MAG: hypothetical protein CMK89_11605 [Pseudomonadales bacterium]|nr:hypothetical protein [Pseudomonadales bacterium]